MMNVPFPHQIERAADVADKVAEWRKRHSAELIDCALGHITESQCAAYQSQYMHQDSHQGYEYDHPRFAKCVGCHRYERLDRPDRKKINSKLWAMRMQTAPIRKANRRQK